MPLGRFSRLYDSLSQFVPDASCCEFAEKQEVETTALGETVLIDLHWIVVAILVVCQVTHEHQCPCVRPSPSYAIIAILADICYGLSCRIFHLTVDLGEQFSVWAFIARIAHIRHVEGNFV